eukprot:SAG22_NODE_14_length_33165_cov_13.196698_3_plen_209_part_00
MLVVVVVVVVAAAVVVVVVVLVLLVLLVPLSPRLLMPHVTLRLRACPQYVIGKDEGDGGHFWMMNVGHNSVESLLHSAPESKRGMENMDRFDRWFGLWRWPAAHQCPEDAPAAAGLAGGGGGAGGGAAAAAAAGRAGGGEGGSRQRPVRRVDLVLVPVEQWAFAVFGWTGSRQVSNAAQKRNAILPTRSAALFPRVCFSACPWGATPF